MSIKVYLLASLCIYAICVTLRFYYPFILGFFPQYFYDNAWLLNTHDAYFYAQGAKDILKILESFIDSNILDLTFKSTLNSPTHEPLSLITAIITFLAPLSLGQILFYLPGFLSTLIIFPMLYITRNFGIIPATLASLLSTLSISYFNRTIFGYYDTDMLILPLTLSIIALILSNTPRVLGLLFALSVFSLWYYPNLRYIFLGFVVILSCFKAKKEEAITLMFSILFVLYVPISFIGAFFWIIIGAIFSFVRIPKNLFWIILCIFIFSISHTLLPNLLNSPFLNTFLQINIESKNLESPPFVNVLDSIVETSKISFTTFAERVSGNIIFFILSLIGYGYLIYQKRIFLLFLPLLILGFFSLLQGARFSFYATPVSAIGFSYLLCCLTKKVPFKPLFQIVFLTITLYPNLLHIKNYTPKPILDSTEAQTLKEIPTQKGDFALAWWDYGYMINYFSNLNVFIDGGKHSGEDNFPISLFLKSNNNLLSYKIARSLLNNTQSLYIILPLSMLEIFPTIIAFSDFSTPKFFAISQNVESKTAFFKNKTTLDLENGTINNQYQISRLINLKTRQTLNFNPKSTLIALKLNDGRILLCDNSYLESFYFQGLFFETLDQNLFQKILKNDKIAVYKLL